MNRIKVIVEVSGGKIIALHSSEDIDFHLIDWDNKGDQPVTWEQECKSAMGSDRLIDKRFDYYMNEILAG